MTELSEVTTTGKIKSYGHSLIVVVTKEADLLNVGAGDTVEVTIKKI